MTFLAPFYFWTFLALIPLLGVYFLKVRPRRVTTTALFLWMRIYEEKRRRHASRAHFEEIDPQQRDCARNVQK